MPRVLQRHIASCLQPLDFVRQLCNPRIPPDKCGGNIRDVIPLRDVLRAIGTPSGDVEQHHLFSPRPIPFGHQPGGQVSVAFHHPRRAPNLDAPPVGIVDQEQTGPRVFGQIARCDELPVASIVDKADRPTALHLQKSHRAAKVLNIGLTLGSGGAQKDAGLCRDKFLQITVYLGPPAASCAA